MLNKVILIGRVGREPEIKYASDGSMVVNFSVVTSEKINGKEYKEWHRIVAWGKIADICAEYLHKGDMVYLEGRMQTQRWEDKDGNKKRNTDVFARNVRVLSRKNNEETAKKPEETMIEDEDVPF